MNNFLIKYSLYSIIIFFIGLSSCSKFEDGPLISLRTKKQRLSRDWKIEYSINKQSGIRHSADYEGWLLSFDKSGSFSKIVIYDNNETKSSGNWDLSGNLLKLEFQHQSGTIREFYTIMRLTSKELWMEDDFEEIHYYSD